MPQEPAIHPGLQRIHDLLFLDMDGEGEFINPDKAWDADTIDRVAAVVCEYIPRPARVHRIHTPTTEKPSSPG